jgi:hypothetical protein
MSTSRRTGRNWRKPGRPLDHTIADSTKSGAAQYIGDIFRWHGAWLAAPAGSDNETRVDEGRGGDKAAAQYLFDAFTAGRITPHKPTPTSGQIIPVFGPLPLLHRRMPATDRNQDAASKAFAVLEQYAWRPLSGYPGSDNLMLLQCGFDGWVGFKHFSHLRGRNGPPPSPHRHPGCILAAEVRARIAAYQQ